MRILRKLSLFILLGLMAILFYSCENKTEEVKVDRNDQFIVGMECAYAPFNWTQSNSSLTSVKITGSNGYCDGYDVKVAKLIALHLDKQLVIKAYDWEGLIPALEKKEIDAIIAGMSPTEERKLSIDFSDVYFRSEQVVIVKKDSPYANAKSINDFKGAEITAQTNTLQEKLTEQLVGAKKSTSLPDYSALVTATSSGTVDGFIAELPVAMKVVSNNNSLTYIRFTEDNGFIVDDAEITTAIGLRKNDTELKNLINEILASISNEKRESWMKNFVEKE